MDDESKNASEERYKVELNKGVLEMMKNLSNTMVTYKLIAKNMKSYYDSLVDAGFTKEQAFEIILKRGLTP